MPVATCTATDDTATRTATLSPSVTPVNDAPVARADTAVTLEETQLAANAAHGVLANDSDVDADTTLSVTQLSIAGVAGTFAAGTTASIPGAGTLMVNADGSYTFTPAANYNGAVPVATYTVSDGQLTTTATLSLSVTPVNDPPVAGNDLASTPINTPVTVAVLANDTDADGDPLIVSNPTLANPAQGTVVVNADCTLGFTPANNFGGTAVITYTVADGQGGTSTATVNINVGANTPPTGTDSARTVAEDRAYTVQAADFGFADVDSGQMLANVRIDTLPGAGTLLLSGVAVATGQVISAADVAAGHLVLVPVANAFGSPYAKFTFTVQDTAGAHDNAPNTFTLNVTSVNDVPAAVADSVSAVEDQPFVGMLGTNDPLSVDGGNVFALVPASGPAHGTLVLAADGSFTHTPSPDHHGADTFTWLITDADGDVSTAVVSINVASVNDVPTAVADTIAAIEDTPFVGSVAGNDLLSGDGGNVFRWSAAPALPTAGSSSTTTVRSRTHPTRTTAAPTRSRTRSPMSMATCRQPR